MVSQRGRRRLWLLALALCAALVIAACGEQELDEEPDTGEAEEAEAEGPEAEEDEEAEAEADPTYYEGEQITILVPAAPGGGADATAQFNAPYLQEHIAGNPGIIIEHDTAAGGIAAGNRYARQIEPDGYTIFLSAFTTTIPWLVGEAEVDYDVASFTQIAAFPYTGVLYVDPEVGIESVEDLPEYADQLVKGGVSPTSTDIMGVLALEVLGVREDIQEIWGYGGTGDHILAFQQGETNFDATTNVVWNNNRFMEEEGDALPLVAYGFLQEDGTFERDPLLPDTPTLDEAHEMIYGEPPSGEAWEAFKDVMAVIHTAHSMVVHGDTPPEAVAALRAAFADAIENTDYLEGWAEANPAPPMHTDDELDEAQAQIQEVDAGFVEWVQEFLETEYPDEFG